MRANNIRICDSVTGLPTSPVAPADFGAVPSVTAESRSPQPQRHMWQRFSYPLDPALRRLQRRARAALRPGGGADRDRRAQQQAAGDRMGEEDGNVAAGDGQRLPERLLQRVAENEAEQQRRLRNVELAERIAQHPEAQ